MLDGLFAPRSAYEELGAPGTCCLVHVHATADRAFSMHDGAADGWLLTWGSGAAVVVPGFRGTRYRDFEGCQQHGEALHPRGGRKLIPRGPEGHTVASEAT